jgi:hypothetical protein
MSERHCEIIGDHSRSGRVVARIEMSWFSRASNQRETEEADVCRLHLESKQREFGPNPEPNMFGPPLGAKFRVVQRYGS